MAEVVTPPLDLDGNAMTAQVVELIGGITLEAIQTLGETIDRETVDNEEDNVFYDANEIPQENKTDPDPAGASCEEQPQVTAGEGGEEASQPQCNTDELAPPAAPAVDEEFPHSLCDTQPPAQPACHEQEEVDKTPSDERKCESLGSESAESTQLLGAESEVLGQPPGGERVTSGNEESGESLSVTTAESTDPVSTANEKLLAIEENDNAAKCAETDESAECLSVESDACAQSSVAESEELPQPENTDTNATSSLNEDSKESIPTTCSESGESIECDSNTEPNVNPENSTQEQNVNPENSIPEPNVNPENSTPEPNMNLDSSTPELNVIPENSTQEPNVSPENSTPEPNVNPENSTPEPDINREESTLEPNVNPENSTPEPDINLEESTLEANVNPENSTPEPDINLEESTLEPNVNSENSMPEPTVNLEICTIEPNENPDNNTLEQNVNPENSSEEPSGNSKNSTPAQSVCTESGETIQPLCDHTQPEPPVGQVDKEQVPPLCLESGQSIHSGSTSDSERPEPSPTSDDQPACEEPPRPDSPASVPEASCPSDSPPETDSATALVTANEDTCESPTNQRERELEETAPDCTACPTELPVAHDNMTTEAELSRSPEELAADGPERLMSKETQTEILDEAPVMSQTQSEQENETAVEVVTEEAPAGEVMTGGDEASGAEAMLGAVGESRRPNGGLESPGDLSSGDELTCDSQDEALDRFGEEGVQQSNTSDTGSPQSEDRPNTLPRKKQHSFSKSKYNTVSYRKIRKCNTRQRIDEFESMMNS